MRVINSNSTVGAGSFLSTFIQGLSHRLRTSLSVISNELTYLTRQTGDDTCALAVKHCNEISRVLSEIDSTLRYAPNLMRVPLEEIMHSLGLEYRSQGGGTEILCDEEAFVPAFRAAIDKLFGGAAFLVMALSEEGQVVVTLTCPRMEFWRTVSHGSYTSLAEIAEGVFERGLLEACLCDAMLDRQGIRFNAEIANDELRINLHFDSPKEGQ